MPTAKTTSAKPLAGRRSRGSSTGNAAKRATATRRPSASKRPTATTKRPSPAERALLIPVGAALVARERLASEVGDTIANYNTTAKANAQLRRFERRGATARNRVERELRKTRVRVERELRQTRGRVEHEITRRRREGEELASRVQERLLNLV